MKTYKITYTITEVVTQSNEEDCEIWAKELEKGVKEDYAVKITHKIEEQV